MRNIPHTFRPIEQWPGNFTKDRRRATFKASYASTLDLLDRELWRLGATSVVIEMALNESEIRRDGLPYSNVRPAHPGVIVMLKSVMLVPRTVPLPCRI